MPMNLFRSKKLALRRQNTLRKLDSKTSQLSTPTITQSEQVKLTTEAQPLGDKFEESYIWNDLGREKTDKPVESDHIANTASRQVRNDDERTLRPGRRASVIDRTKLDLYHAPLLDDDSQGNEDDSPAGDKQLHEVENHAPTQYVLAPTQYVLAPSNVSNYSQLVVGQQDSKAPYFTRRLRTLPLFSGSASEDASLGIVLSEVVDKPSYSLAELDPHALKLYGIWTQTGSIPTPSQDAIAQSNSPDTTWQACWPLMNAVMLGNIVKDVDFMDQAMDILSKHVLEGVCADTDTITHIFSEVNKEIPNVLERFVVSRCLYSGSEQLESLKLSILPCSFLATMLKRVLGDLSGREVWSPLDPDCAYHSHQRVEDCYKRKRTGDMPRQIAKSRVHWVKSLQDSEEDTTIAERYSVRTQYQKQRANQAVHRQDGKSVPRTATVSVYEHNPSLLNSVSLCTNAEGGHKDAPQINSDVHTHRTCPGAFPGSRGSSFSSVATQ